MDVTCPSPVIPHCCRLAGDPALIVTETQSCIGSSSIAPNMKCCVVEASRLTEFYSLQPSDLFSVFSHLSLHLAHSIRHVIFAPAESVTIPFLSVYVLPSVSLNSKQCNLGLLLLLQIICRSTLSDLLRLGHPDHQPAFCHLELFND